MEIYVLNIRSWEGFVLLLGKVRIRTYLLRMLYGRKAVLGGKKNSTFFWGPSTMAPIQELGLTFLGSSLWNQRCVGAASGCLSLFTLQQKLYETKIKPSLATSKDGEKKVSGSPWWVPYWTYFEFFPRILGGKWPVRRKRDLVRESKIHLWIPANLAQ